MNPTCKQIQRRAERWFELSKEEQGDVRDHAAACASCREALAGVLQVDGSLGAAQAAHVAVHYKGPRPAWQQGPSTKKTIGWLHPAWAALMAVIVVAGAFWGLRNNKPPTTQATQPGLSLSVFSIRPEIDRLGDYPTLSVSDALTEGRRLAWESRLNRPSFSFQMPENLNLHLQDRSRDNPASTENDNT